jgi:hypothetical protein
VDESGQKGVGITGTVFQPLYGPQVIDECCEQVLHIEVVETEFPCRLRALL